MTQVKICGLTSVDEALYLNKYKADYAGMVLFFSKSKRNIDIALAKRIISALDQSIKKVAVVVSPTAEQARALCLAGFDIIQVHGSLQKEVYDVISADIWKAFNINDMDQYEIYAHMDKIKGFVFDSASPGSGKSWDIQLLQQVNVPKDKLFILAGGLNSDNVAEAIKQVQPDVADVSSGVECANKPGKDPAKIASFIKMVQLSR